MGAINQKELHDANMVMKGILELTPFQKELNAAKKIQKGATPVAQNDTSLDLGESDALDAPDATLEGLEHELKTATLDLDEHAEHVAQRREQEVLRMVTQ